MDLGVRKIGGSVLSFFFRTQFVPVRYRYHADKIARGPLFKKFGYKDNVAFSGVLPRLKDAEPLPGPIYTPSSAWTREKVLKGRNDYIDILGGGKLRPTDVSYEIPRWLRGQKGNEYQLLLLKSKVFSRTLYEVENPSLWSNMSRRILYLYRYLNRKTKTGFSKKQ